MRSTSARFALIVIGIGILSAIGAMFLFAATDKISIPGVLEPTPTGSGTSLVVPAAPSRLRIPSIGVDAAIQSVGRTQTGDMGIPTNFTDVAWYNEGPRPGLPGSAAIAGHVDGRNTPKAVFYDLNKLAVGDVVIVVDADGQEFKFRVTETKIFNYEDSAVEVFSKSGPEAHLNLITCTGLWIKDKRVYDQRLVVFTELMK